MKVSMTIQDESRMPSSLLSSVAPLWSRRVAVVFVIVTCFAASTASAESLERGRGVNAQPGVLRTLSGFASAPGSWTISASGSYGWQPNLLVEGDSAQRTWGRLALSYAPWRFFQAALSIEQFIGLYSNADGESGGLVSGSVGDPRLSLRTGWALGGGFSIAGQVELWFPSGIGDFSVAGRSISPFVSVATSFAPESVPLGVHLQVGYHHNRSGEMLRQFSGFTPESLALSGVTSSLHHLVLGLAFEYRLGPVAPFVELTSDLPMDNGGLDKTWLLVGLGARLWLGPDDAAQLSLGLEIRALEGGTDPDTETQRVWESPPLVNAMVGFALTLPIRRQGPIDDTTVTTLDDSGSSPDPAASAVVGGRARGRVLCGEEPCGRGTLVEVVDSGGSPFLVDPTTGSFTTIELAPGIYQLRATTDGAEPVTADVEVRSGEIAEVTLALDRPESVATGIRGRVTDFNGQPVQAQVRIPALDIELETDADGQFELEAPPGIYQVMIWANGYQTQTSRQEVPHGGMVVMNVELRQRRR
jgi:hypothetical protein